MLKLYVIAILALSQNDEKKLVATARTQVLSNVTWHYKVLCNVIVHQN